MRLLPPDLSSFIRAKLTFSKHSSSPLNLAGVSSNSLELPKSVDLIKQSSPSGSFVREVSADSLLDTVSSSQNQYSRQIMTFIQSIGLPQDMLSASLISFFKFFSLPLDAEALKQIRREVLESKSAKNAEALAASAAFDKGVSLSDEALREYAAAIDPNERSSEKHNGAENGFGQSSQNNQEKRNTDEKHLSLSEEIKNLIEDIDEKENVLHFLNRIPGKNGQKWLVLPFNFTLEEKYFNVSLRILLNESEIPRRSVERFALDVKTDKRRWLFVALKEKDDSYNGKIALSPNISQVEQSILTKELKEILGNFVKDICFIDENNILSLVDSRNDLIISVDEEV